MENDKLPFNSLSVEQLERHASASEQLDDCTAESLRQADERFQLIYEHTATGVAVADANNKLMQCNPALCKMLGYTEVELKQLHFPDLIHPEDREANLILVRKLRSGEIPSFDIENRYISKSGAIVWVHKSVALLFDADGNPTHTFALVTDITRRKQAENQIERALSDLQLLIDSVPAYVSFVDTEQRYRLVNKRYEAYFRTPAAQIVGKHLREVQSPEAYAAMEPHVRAALAGESVHYQFSTQGPDERLHWFDVQYIPRKENGGLVSGFFVLVFDITGRKTAEKALERSEERYRSLFEQVVDGIFIADATGHYISVNSAGTQMLGYTHAEICALQISDVIAPREHSRLPEQFAKLKSGSVEINEWQFRRKDGSEFPGEVVARQLPDGYLLGIVRDITARKYADAALRDSEERYRVTFENAAVGIAHVAPDGRWLRFNDRICEIVGYTRNELLQKTFADITHPDDIEGDWKLARQVLAGEIDTYSMDKRYIRKDGSPVWIALTVSLVRKPGGEPDYFISIIRDIDALKKAEAELQRAKTNAEGANRAKDNFLAILGHELRNPLAPIRYSLELMKECKPGQDQSRARNVIERQVAHMTRLIDDLLDNSRIANGKIILRKEPANLVETIKNVILDHRDELNAAGIQLEFQPPREPMWIIGDKVRIAQVVGNLLSNSVKFTNRGGRITVDLGTTTDKQATITVRDTGVGITAEALKYIFKPFAQSEHTLDRSHGGLGLGLALVRGMVELHGGTVKANSPGAGKGAEFVVTLPGVTTAPANREESPKKAAAARKRKVLIIEDNTDTADSLRMFLAMHGHAVEVAHNGTDGLELARSRKPEVVFCDIGLPGMTGYEVAGAIRADRELCSVLLIAMTGFGQNQDRKRAKEAGFDRHLTKPADTEVLLSLLA